MMRVASGSISSSMMLLSVALRVSGTTREGTRASALDHPEYGSLAFERTLAWRLGSQTHLDLVGDAFMHDGMTASTGAGF